MSFLANKIRAADGRFAVTLAPLTEAQLEELIAGATRLAVPRPLKWEWRRWSLARRGWFIQRLRARLRLPGERPDSPFSANVEPFDYASPRAWEIVNRMNSGRDSRNAAVKLNICSQGVICENELWFWCRNTGYQRGPWNPRDGRPLLHRHLWERRHGRRLSPLEVVVFSDGNDNNLSPDNLALATKDDICRQNQAAALQRKSRERVGLLLKLNRKEHHHANIMQTLGQA